MRLNVTMNSNNVINEKLAKHLSYVLCFVQMPGVTVKDVNQQEFVRALAAFLKK